MANSLLKLVSRARMPVIVMLFVLGLVTAPCASVALAQGVPMLDGGLDNLYLSHGYSLDYDGFYPQAAATLYVLDSTALDPNYIWLAWVVGRGFNDNSYGANKHSSWPRGHGFDDLLESDMQRLDLENSCGEMVLDATMDLLDGGEYHDPYPTESGYDVNMDATESIKDYINGGDWSESSFAYDTSLARNLNDLGYCVDGDCTVGGTDLAVDSPPWQDGDDSNYGPVSAYGQWEYSLIWELRIGRSVFITGTCPQGGVLGVATNPIELHASPSKAGVSPVTLIPSYSAIGDYVWLDADRDGVQDSNERGIANVTLALYSDPNGNGDPSDGTVLTTTTTDANGRYLFDKLGSGDYVVAVTDDYGALTGLAMTAGSVNPHGPISLTVNESYRDADFGYAPSDPMKCAVGDYVWSDASDDGIQADGEPGIGGVSLGLLTDYDGDGNFTDVVSTATTHDDGSYMFLNLDPGAYKVVVIDTAGVLSGYTLTVGPQSSTDPTALITLNAGDVHLRADFGYYRDSLGTIGNQVWLDKDSDGLFEPGDGEDGIPYVTLDLIKDGNGNGAWDPGERIIATTLTGWDRTYQFSGLLLDDGDGDADYLVTVGDVYGKLRRYRKSKGPTQGADRNSQPDPYPLALWDDPVSRSNQTADFGYFFDQDEGLVGDRVWLDLTFDGTQDEGEPAIEGVEVRLWRRQGSNWRVRGTTTTDANGDYYFPRLDIGGGGRYYRVEVLASNFSPGGALAGLTPTNQPDNEDESGRLNSSNRVDLALDFGYFGTTTAVQLASFTARPVAHWSAPVTLPGLLAVLGVAAAGLGAWRVRYARR